MRLRIIVFISTVAALAGCTAPDELIGRHGESEYVRVVDVPPRFNRNLDLLFVVDNTETMTPKQMALIESFRRITAHLTHMRGGLPNMHLGVVSTDVGVGPHEVPTCNPTGDGGTLQSAPRFVGCAAPDDQFIRHDDINTNHDGSLWESFACISALGNRGCAFEQPLEAMRMALDGYNEKNDGFLRDNAALGVIFLTDEDDCSADDTTMFDPNLMGEGQTTKFRCFEHGVTCDGDDVRKEGDLRGCVPRQDSRYMPPVEEYASFLRDIKGDSSQIVVTGIMGDADLVNVKVGVDEQYEIQPACVGSTGKAYPAVRLQGFLNEFPKGGDVGSLCGEDGFDVLRAMSKQLRKTLGTTCLDGNVRDVDPDTAGTQPDCHVFDITPAMEPGPIPMCSVHHAPWLSDRFPCYRILAGPESCGDFPGHQLALDVCRGVNANGDWCLQDAQPAFTHTVAECLLADN